MPKPKVPKVAKAPKAPAVEVPVEPVAFTHVPPVNKDGFNVAE